MCVAGITELEEAINDLNKRILIVSKEVLNLREAAIYTDMTEWDFKIFVNKTKLPSYKTCGEFYFKKSDIDKILVHECINTKPSNNTQ